MRDDAPRVVGTYGPRTSDDLARVLQGDSAAACDLVELRLDFLADAEDAVGALIALAPAPVLATCRRAGAVERDETTRLDLLRRAAGAGAAWVDVEEEVPEEALRRIAAEGARVLRSAHLEELPSDADRLADALTAPPAHLGKLVVRRGSERDAVRLLELCAARPGRLVGHVVGAPATRLASLAVGAPWTYGALRRGGLLDVPLPTVRELLDRRRLRRVLPGAPLFLLLGRGVAGSVSPDLLNAAFERLGAATVALPWECDDPLPLLEAIERFGWAGAAVTIPHKVRVLEHFMGTRRRASDTAARAGAANTVVRDGEGLAAHLTDVDGLLDALRPHLPGAGVAGRTALVLGAGGAARAAVAALRRLEAEPHVYARRADAAAALGAGVCRSPEDALRVAPAVVVDATPAGPPGGTPFLDPRPLPGPVVVLDMLVSARPTALLEAALVAGHRPVPGFEMLLHQAAHQVRLLHGREPDLAAMDAAGSAALVRRDLPIVLVGLRGAGKTALGRALARLLARPFLDTDDEVERTTGARPDALLRAGEEPAFRAAEAEALRCAARAAGAVVATGGGAALHAAELGALAALGVVVLVDAPDQVLLARLEQAPRAPLSSLPPGEELARQREERMPRYRTLARLVVDTSRAPVEETAEDLADALDRMLARAAPRATAPSSAEE